LFRVSGIFLITSFAERNRILSKRNPQTHKPIVIPSKIFTDGCENELHIIGERYDGTVTQSLDSGSVIQSNNKPDLPLQLVAKDPTSRIYITNMELNVGFMEFLTSIDPFGGKSTEERGVAMNLVLGIGIGLGFAWVLRML
jgi:hypothetical protein